MSKFVLNPKLAQLGLRPSDGVDDMTHISNIDVDGIDENLHVRYNKDKIYTYSGTILVAVNPYKHLPIYEGFTMEQYHRRKFNDLSPHIFAIAEASYFNIRHNERNQSCIISGESGAGKTETTKFILQYLCHVSTSATKWVDRQILEANTILEAFGNARTVRNDNSSRFGKFMQVYFDHEHNICGSVIQEYLLEQSRITFQAYDERNYHVFYQLVKGGDKSKYMLEDVKSYNYLSQSGCFTLPDVDDKKEFEALSMALTVMNIEEEMIQGIFSLVSAVLLIGNIQFVVVDEDKAGLSKTDETLVKKISSLLKISNDLLTAILVRRSILVRGVTTVIPFTLTEAKENRNAMAKALYSRTFTWLVDRINMTTHPGRNAKKFIGVLDIFGFENFQKNSFEQLCINFTNEKLHKFFNHYVFALEQAEYNKEGISFAHISFTDNTECLELIEKPPTCVLRLLDEECRFPKGTDKSFLAKIQEVLGQHPRFIKGDSKINWSNQFGVRHYAGPVYYCTDGLLDKNRDVVQDELFEGMRKSAHPFIRDLTRYQDLLGVERRAIMGKLFQAPDNTVHRASESDFNRTNKAKPTVGDTFRRQLQLLLEVLDTTNPWYVRCIKPNQSKAPRLWEKSLVLDQLRYSGMLDIIRIRREGYPIHMKIRDFLSRYRVIATMRKVVLSADEREACAQLMQILCVPISEWQVGRNKVFLRYSIYEPLEEKVNSLIGHDVAKIQALWRAYQYRKDFKKRREAAIKIQGFVRAAALRMEFVRMKKAAVKIQAQVRGWRVRENVADLKGEKRLEQQRKAEEEARLRGEAIVEESFLAAQNELNSLTRLADANSKKNKEKEKPTDLDAMFTFLAVKKEDSMDKRKGENFAKQMNEELDTMFEEQAPRPEGKRTMRRKKRLEEKAITHEETKIKHTEEEFDPSLYPMIKYAEKYFNDIPRSNSLQRKGSKVLDLVSKEEMLMFSKSSSLVTSLVHMHNPENVDLACSIFKDIVKMMKGETKPDQAINTMRQIISSCLDREELCDEVFCQLIKQTTNNPSPDAQTRAWLLLMVCCASVHPSKHLYKFLQAHIYRNLKDSLMHPYAQWSLDALRLSRFNGTRKLPPSTTEIKAIQTRHDIVLRFHFLDGQAKAINVHPCATAADVLKQLCERIGLDDVEGWSIYEATPEYERFIRSTTYIGDILSQWESDNRSSMNLTSYSTSSRKGPTAAIGGGDCKFIFKKRLYYPEKEKRSHNQVEYDLTYAQLVHRVVVLDEFPFNEKVCLQLAGLQLQAAWGPSDEEKLSRYDEVEHYLPSRIRAGKAKDHWVQALYEAHTTFGDDKSAIQARVVYVTAVKMNPLYSGTLFNATFKGFWSFPSKIILSVHYDGIKFVHMKTKEILFEFTYPQLRTMEVNLFDFSIAFNMNGEVLPDGSITRYIFQADRTEEIAHLVASYSLAHRNWKQVGAPQLKRKHANNEDRARAYTEVRHARRRLAEAYVLQQPTLDSRGSAPSLRRALSRSKILQQDDYERIFDTRYFSFSKIKLLEPLSLLTNSESLDSSLQCFELILFYSGLLNSPPCAIENNDTERNGAIQYVTARCLEKPELANEVALQLIKQTTDYPDPNGTINQANWRFLTLFVSVLAPSNPHVLHYLKMHLTHCALGADNEEGKFALFANQCLSRTLENKNRRCPPSLQEIKCVGKRSLIYSKFYFMDGVYRAIMFDSAATAAEVTIMIKERIGMAFSVPGYSVSEVFGPMARNLLAREKIADSMYRWEKYAASIKSPFQLQLTFKKRLFVPPYAIPDTQVEFDLVLAQGLDDIRNDRFPLTEKEMILIVALQAQISMYDYTPPLSDITPSTTPRPSMPFLARDSPVHKKGSKGSRELIVDTPDSAASTLSRHGSNHSLLTMYEHLMIKHLPHHVRGLVQPEDVAEEHTKLKGLSAKECSLILLNLILTWPFYGTTLFEVTQTYTTAMPKSLWLGINDEGFHIFRRHAKTPLASHSFDSIVSYSPSLQYLMIITESLSRGTKFVFNTTQGSQIAHLIRDYTTIILQRRTTGKVNFDPLVLEPDEGQRGDTPANFLE